MSIQAFIKPFLHPDQNTPLDGMEWVRIGRIASLAFNGGAAEQKNGLTPFGLIAREATGSSLFLREIIKPLIRAGAPLFGDDRAFEHFTTNSAFSPVDLDVFLDAMIEPGELGRQCDADGKTVLHLLALHNPQLLGDSKALGDLPGAGHPILRRLFSTQDLDGNLPLHLLLAADGCIAASPGFQYPGEQLCAAICRAACDAALWDTPNQAGQTPMDLLTERLSEHEDSVVYVGALANYLGEPVIRACTEIERKKMEQQTQPVASASRNRVRL